MRIYQNVSELIGNTPLLALNNYTKNRSLSCNIWAKAECMNPAGSAKDRVARAMLDSAEAQGKVTADTVIIEPTSGNTGIALAALCAARGYRMILTMPDTMSKERCDLLRAYGAEVVLTEGAKGMQGSIERAEELARSFPHALIPSQFKNPQNPASHRETTGPEIWRDTDGQIDIFVACIGTGGTLSGTGTFLKQQDPHIRIVGVEPAESPLLTEGRSGPHGIQGIGANFVPDTLKRDIIDEILCVTTADACVTARSLAREEGLLCGISSGCALYAATVLAQREENRGKHIVALLPDSGERYLSCGVFL